MKNIKNKIKDLLLIYKSLSVKKILIIWIFLILSILFLILAFKELNKKFLIEIPTYGGEINEGIIGTPRFINPVLAYSSVDKDLSKLIYSGLTKKDINGNIILDLAEKISISEDYLQYNVTLKDNLIFHDKTPITTEDIIFTISKIQDKNINSPIAINFEGVNMQKISDKEMIFTLKKPYFHFEEALSVGILPKHIWQNLNIEEFSFSDLNINAIGSGPFKIKNIIKNSGIPTKIELISFKNYSLGRPYLNNLNIYFYNNKKDLKTALLNKEIENTNNLNKRDIKDINIKEKQLYVKTSSLPNLYSLSFNPNKNIILADKNIRLALNVSLDKANNINIFEGDVKATNSNLPFLNINTEIKNKNIDLAKEYLEKYNTKKINNNSTTSKKKLQKNTKITDIKSKINTLTSTSTINSTSTNSTTSNIITITISTANDDDLINVAENIKKNWEELGFEVKIKIYELSDLTQNIIKNRDFEVLLFGSIIEKDIDLYAYWHSSQTKYPGLNITGYASKNLDKELEDLRKNTNKEMREKILLNIKTELENELYQIPLYSKYSTYITSNNFEIPEYLSENNERFSNINNWHIYTENVWKKIYEKQKIEKLQNLIH